MTSRVSDRAESDPNAGESSRAKSDLQVTEEAAEGRVRALCCEMCGSENVVWESRAKWNPEKGRFELAEVSDTQEPVDCMDCGEGGLGGTWQWRERSDPLYGCTACGCTDIEYQSWVELNTGVISDDCGSSNIWCPKCEDSESRCEEVSRQKPYRETASDTAA